MEDILVKLNDNCIAHVKLTYPLPVTLTPDYDTKGWRASRNGISTKLETEAQQRAYFTKLWNEINGEIPARISSVTFLQKKYKKKPFNLLNGEWQTILKAVSGVTPKRFTDAQQLYEDCIPDYDY